MLTKEQQAQAYDILSASEGATSNNERRGLELIEALKEHYDASDVETVILLAMEEIRHACDACDVDYYDANRTALTVYTREVFNGSTY